MNYLVYPTEKMKLTQDHTEGNHNNHSAGSPKDYPFDECCGDTGRSAFLCPCDEMKIVKIYTAGVNTVWMTSTAPVVMPCGSTYVTIMVEHPEDEDLKKLSVGQIFRRGEQMFREGKDGATGNHFHISVGTGHMKESGWRKNSLGAWVLTVTGKPLTAAEAFYVGDTEDINHKNYHFKSVPKETMTMGKLDNTPDSYAKEAVKWAKESGVLKGDTDGNLKLHEAVTRQDMLVFLYRAKSTY